MTKDKLSWFEDALNDFSRGLYTAKDFEDMVMKRIEATKAQLEKELAGAKKEIEAQGNFVNDREKRRIVDKKTIESLQSKLEKAKEALNKINNFTSCADNFLDLNCGYIAKKTLAEIEKES